MVYFLGLAGQDIKEKSSGAVEAFSRRNPGRHGEHSRPTRSDEVTSSKDVVMF